MNKEEQKRLKELMTPRWRVWNGIKWEQRFYRPAGKLIPIYSDKLETVYRIIR